MAIMKFENGSVYDGAVFNDDPHGMGRMTRADGSVEYGYWEAGFLLIKSKEPTTWQEYMDLGGEFIDEDDCKNAIEMFTKAISLSKTNEESASAYYMRGLCYLNMRKVIDTITDFEKAADYGSAKALEELRKKGVDYTPRKPSSSTGSQAPKPTLQPSGSSTSMPPASPALLKQYSNYKYVLGMYDWIDNLNGTWKGNRGKGHLIIAMDKTDGNPDIKNAKFIFDGFSEGMLVRNNKQVVYLPVMDNYIKNILLRVIEVFIAEMDNKNNIKEYTVKIDVINSSLPIPVPEKNRMKAQLK